MTKGWNKLYRSKLLHVPWIIFVLIPLVLFFLIYFGPSNLSSFAVVSGLVVFVVFVVFLFLKRPNEKVALGAILPPTLGPLIAYAFVKGVESPLLNVLHAGGDILVQLCFYFAGLLGLVLYVFSKIGESGKIDKLISKIGYVFVIGCLFLAIICGKDFAPVPGGSECQTTIWSDPQPVSWMSWIDPPPLTPLLVGRALLVIFGVLAATRPYSGKT